MTSLRKRIEDAIAKARSTLVDPDALDEAVARMCSDGSISAGSADTLRKLLPAQIEGSRYILNNLAAHVGLGVIFALDMLPLPMGIISRVSWVAGNRALETIRGNRERARVHSLGVLLLASIPWLGYVSYLFALRKESAELAFVLANRVWLGRTDRTYEQFIADAPSLLARLARWVVPVPKFVADEVLRV